MRNITAVKTEKNSIAVCTQGNLLMVFFVRN